MAGGHAAAADDNAISCANTPILDQLYLRKENNTLLEASGKAVGLDQGQMGNSEVGHLTIGSGRIIYQHLVQINHAIDSGSFATRPAFRSALATPNSGTIHIMGLLSRGGVHSHERHLFAAADMAAADPAIKKICFHVFLDGRDTPPKSARDSLLKLEDCCLRIRSRHGCEAFIASVCGRYYAMDRDKRYERTKTVWELLVHGRAAYRFEHALAALTHAYQRGESDEFVKPTIIDRGAKIAARDIVLFMNFRADRARQLTRALIQPDFTGFERDIGPIISPDRFVTLTSYAADIEAPYAFERQNIAQTLGQCIADAGLRQLRVAETEKYAHVTFFFNGGCEQPYQGEQRVLIPSPQVATYDLKPEMSAIEMTDRLVTEIQTNRWDFIVCNFANGDMVGHTGKMEAAVKAVATVDQCLGRILAALEKQGGECLITADHGNCEQMDNPHDNQAHTAHTTHCVPFIYAGKRNLTITSRQGGLRDVAPTVLYLKGLKQPSLMTGQSLLNEKN